MADQPATAARKTLRCAYCNRRYDTLDGFPSAAFAECWKCVVEHYYVKATDAAHDLRVHANAALAVGIAVGAAFGAALAIVGLS